ncbi:MAG TPA: hypothetical protein PKY95_06305, partial [candidate division Zixibacteria bacterium]|nr:hypothetical protein [candidate division Zixibacteria bacterium]
MASRLHSVSRSLPARRFCCREAFCLRFRQNRNLFAVFKKLRLIHMNPVCVFRKAAGHFYCPAYARSLR